MAGVVPTLKAGNDISVFGQQVDDFPFSFIAPLGADDHKI
jgi:hypothetical protein